MASNFIQDLTSQLQDKMLLELKGSNIHPHPVDKGDNTEANWITFFRNNLPKRYNIDNGHIVDCKGNISDQIDVIIYDTNFSPIVFENNNIKYITAESVFAVFEVKPTLNKEYIDYAAKKAKSVRTLHRTSASIIYSTGPKPAKTPHKIIAGLLTTNNSWTKDESLIKSLESLNEEEELDLICSISSLSARISYNREPIKILGKIHGEIVEVDFDRNKTSSILMNFYLNLLLILQAIGTVPAIEYSKYFADVDSIQEIYDDLQ